MKNAGGSFDLKFFKQNANGLYQGIPISYVYHSNEYLNTYQPLESHESSLQPTFTYNSGGDQISGPL